MASSRGDAAGAGKPSTSGPERDSPRRRAMSSGSVAAAMRAACNPSQSLPSCTGSDAADSASMKPTSSRVMPSATTGPSPISGTRTSRPRCSESQRRASVRPPPATTAAITRPDRRRHPVVDGGDRDDVDVGGGNAGGGQRDRADAPARPAVEPPSGADQRAGQHRSRGDAELRAQDAGLRGEDEEQHHADERDGDACDGERLADPAVGARRAAARRAAVRWGGGHGRWRSR